MKYGTCHTRSEMGACKKIQKRICRSLRNTSNDLQESSRVTGQDYKTHICNRGCYNIQNKNVYNNITQDVWQLWGSQPAAWVRKLRDRHLQTDGVLTLVHILCSVSILSKLLTSISYLTLLVLLWHSPAELLIFRTFSKTLTVSWNKYVQPANFIRDYDGKCCKLRTCCGYVVFLYLSVVS
jgi:hypothetical protein